MDIYFTTKNEKAMSSIPFSTESSISKADLKEKRFMEIREILSTVLLETSPNILSWESKDRVIHLRRRSNAISQAVNRFGKVILLSSTKRRWEEVLSLYRQRDAVEKEFDNLKNDLDVMPLRVSKLSTLRGLLFIFFISLVIRSLLLQKARNAELLGKNSIEDILLDLAKLRAVKIGGVWKLTEITKKERIVLEKMGVGIPIKLKHGY